MNIDSTGDKSTIAVQSAHNMLLLRTISDSLTTILGLSIILDTVVIMRGIHVLTHFWILLFPGYFGARFVKN